MCNCAHFIFNKCPIYTHDGASAKFSPKAPETDNSVRVFVFKSFDKAYLQLTFLTVPKGFDGVQIISSLGIVKFIPGLE